MGFASFNFSEYGNSVQNILVSLEIEIPVYDVGLLCDSGLTARVAPPQCCAPVHGCPSPSALRLRPLSPSRVCRLSAVPPCTAARDPSRLLRRRRCRAPVHGRPGPQPSPRPAGAVPTRRARFLVRSGTSYFRSDRTHEFVWWKWKVGHSQCSATPAGLTHTSGCHTHILMMSTTLSSISWLMGTSSMHSDTSSLISFCVPTM